MGDTEIALVWYGGIALGIIVFYIIPTYASRYDTELERGE